MSNYDLSGLKARQDKLEARKSKLLENFIPFRNDLVTQLEQFTKEAKEIGLPGIKRCVRKQDSDRILEVRFSMRGDDLALIATNDTYLLDLRYDLLVSKIFIFSAESDECTPMVEIVFGEERDGSYTYFAEWPTVKGSKPLSGKRKVTSEAGEKAADVLINFFYDLKYQWAEKPTLGSLRKGKDRGRSVGFQAE